MSLGTNLFELRKNKKWTQGFLAEKLGVSRQSVSKWELDESVPDLSNLNLLSTIYEVSVDALLGNEPLFISSSEKSNTAENSHSGNESENVLDSTIFEKDGESASVDAEEETINEILTAGQSLTASERGNEKTLFRGRLTRAIASLLVGVIILGTMAFVCVLVPSYKSNNVTVSDKDVGVVVSGQKPLLPKSSVVSVRMRVQGDFSAFLETYRLHWLAFIASAAIVYSVISLISAVGKTQKNKEGKHKENCKGESNREIVIEKEPSESVS